jgi:hypothetical protein
MSLVSPMMPPGPVRSAAMICAVASMLGCALAPSGPGELNRAARNFVSR